MLLEHKSALVMECHILDKKELKDYGTSKATVRFPHKEKLPVALIKKLIKAQMKKNQEAK